MTLISSAGNYGDYGVRISFPAKLRYVIAVGATDQGNRRTAFSALGWNDRYLDVMAPGQGILSTTKLGSSSNYGIADGYSFYDGTSMAASHAAGVAALLYSAGITSPVEIKEYLTKTATDIETAGNDQHTGWGVINAFQAVAMAKLRIVLIDETSRRVLRYIRPNPTGSFEITGIPNGLYRIGAWIDTNNDLVLNEGLSGSGDYYGESTAPVNFTGGTINIPSFQVERYLSLSGIVLNP